jgi:hypothetical protein
METNSDTTITDECVLCGNEADDRAIPSIHGTTCGDCVIMLERDWDGDMAFARSWSETAADYGKRVMAAIEGWTDEQQSERGRLALRWATAAEEMFWANHFGQPITDEMRAAAYEAGEAVLNA